MKTVIIILALASISYGAYKGAPKPAKPPKQETPATVPQQPTTKPDYKGEAPLTTSPTKICEQAKGKTLEWMEKQIGSKPYLLKGSSTDETYLIQWNRGLNTDGKEHDVTFTVYTDNETHLITSCFWVYTYQ